MNFMSAGTLISGGQHWGQQYVAKVQHSMGWLSGGSMTGMFAISQKYVASKLLMLLAPYLRRWTYNRQPEQIQGGQKYLPPRLDVNSPDLFIPIMSAWTYVLIVCGLKALHNTFTPDLMYSAVWGACLSWVVHLAVAKVVLKAMQLSSVPYLELLAYTGYAFLPACSSALVGHATGKWGYWATWFYGSFCMAVFLVRTIKRIILRTRFPSNPLTEHEPF
jgi:hypothetical protein